MPKKLTYERSFVRRIKPHKGIPFSCSEIKGFFDRGLLKVDKKHVVDNGFLLSKGDYHTTCPNCGLVWEDVLFEAADNACCCGYILLNEEDLTDSVTWFIYNYSKTTKNLYTSDFKTRRKIDDLADTIVDHIVGRKTKIHAALSLIKRCFKTLQNNLDHKFQRRRHGEILVWGPGEIIKENRGLSSKTRWKG